MDQQGKNPPQPIDREQSGTRTDATQRMQRAIKAAKNGDGSRMELEDAARALVSLLRREHQRPEQALLQIKTILTDAGLRPSYATPEEPDRGVGAEASLYRDVIAWSIRYYYGATS